MRLYKNSKLDLLNISNSRGSPVCKDLIFHRDRRYTTQHSDLIDLSRNYIQYGGEVVEDNCNLGTLKLPINGYKPNGIWYAFGREWLEWHWFYRTRTDDELPPVFELEVDTNKFVSLNSEEKIFAFNQEYQIKSGDFNFINWAEVSKKYDGIEAYPFDRMFTELKWYQSLDISSGCIWNLNAIKNIVRIN